MATRIQLRRGTSAQWLSSNPVLAPGGAGISVTLNTGDVLANIWKRVAWSGDTW